MLLPALLESRPQSGVIWHEIFRQSPKAIDDDGRRLRSYAALQQKIPAKPLTGVSAAIIVHCNNCCNATELEIER
jgi:hypothetical protein